MFFILLFNALLALAELTAAFESRPILMKHKSLSVNYLTMKKMLLTCLALFTDPQHMLWHKFSWMFHWYSYKWYSLTSSFTCTLSYNVTWS